jgi:hypothetical protein
LTGKGKGRVDVGDLDNGASMRGGAIAPDIEVERGINGPNAGGDYATEVLAGGNNRAIAGHGELRPGSGNFEIPEGTTLVAPKHGIKITDTTGRLLENIDIEAFANAGAKARNRLVRQQLDTMGIKNKRVRNRVFQDLKDVRVLKAGDSVENYTIKTPDNLRIHENSTTVESSAPLKEVLKSDAGVCTLATCTEIRS